MAVVSLYMAEAGLLAGLELVVRLVLVLVLQEVRSQGRREWMRKIGVDHNTHTHFPFPTTSRALLTLCSIFPAVMRDLPFLVARIPGLYLVRIPALVIVA